LVRFVVVILAIGAVAYCVYRYRVGLGHDNRGISQQSANSDQTNSGPATAHPAHIVWQPLDRSQDGFKVEMPEGVRETQIPAYDERGDIDRVEMIYAYPDSETIFAVTWADNPPVEQAGRDDADRTLDLARDGALTRTQATLTGESRDPRGGFPACDFSGRNQGGGILNARLILAGRRLYMLIAAFPAASARRDEDVRRFLDSFSLVSTASND
jgi:hypothetical protein